MFPSPLDNISLDALQIEEEAEEQEEEPDEFIVFLNQEITECFAIFDRKKTGELEAKYLGKALGSLGLTYTETELADVQDALETQGVVTFEKFSAYCLEKLSLIEAYDSLRIAFKAFDPDGEGFFSVDRFKKWMTTLGDPLTDKEVKDLIKLGDPAGKGIIFYDDLASVLILK